MIGIPRKCRECRYLSGIGYCQKIRKLVNEYDTDIYDKPDVCNIKDKNTQDEGYKDVDTKREWFKNVYLRKKW